MPTDRAELQKIFTGHWDGGEGEFHGKVRARGSDLMVECLERDDAWHVSVFAGGEATATATDVDVRRAIATALKETLRGM